MKNLDPDTVKRLETVAAIVVPGYSSIDSEGRVRFLDVIDEALGERPESMQRQLALFLKVLNVAPYLRWGRPLARLETVDAERALRWFQEAPIAKLRQGFWGLKTLVFMGYYGQSEVWPEVGYSQDFDGGAFDV
ncbi:MAG: hypothetical protein ABFS37_05180 [Acidobacteriota bacterium]